MEKAGPIRSVRLSGKPGSLGVGETPTNVSEIQKDIPMHCLHTLAQCLLGVISLSSTIRQAVVHCNKDRSSPAESGVPVYTLCSQYPPGAVPRYHCCEQHRLGLANSNFKNGVRWIDLGCAQFPSPSETEAEPEAPAPEIIPDQDPELVPAQEPTTEVTPAPEPESDPIPPGEKTLPYKAVST